MVECFFPNVEFFSFYFCYVARHVTECYVLLTTVKIVLFIIFHSACYSNGQIFSRTLLRCVRLMA